MKKIKKQFVGLVVLALFALSGCSPATGVEGGTLNLPPSTPPLSTEKVESSETSGPSKTVKPITSASPVPLPTPTASRQPLEDDEFADGYHIDRLFREAQEQDEFADGYGIARLFPELHDVAVAPVAHEHRPAARARLGHWLSPRGICRVVVAGLALDHFLKMGCAPVEKDSSNDVVSNSGPGKHYLMCDLNQLPLVDNSSVHNGDEQALMLCLPNHAPSDLLDGERHPVLVKGFDVGEDGELSATEAGFEVVSQIEKPGISRWFAGAAGAAGAAVGLFVHHSNYRH